MFNGAATVARAARADVSTTIGGTGASGSRIVRMSAGTTVFHEGDSCGGFYSLLAGLVRVSKALSDGRRQIMWFIFPGEVFTASGLGFEGSEVATCSADAVTPIEIIDHSGDSLERLIDQRPDFARHLLAESGRRLVRAQQRMVLLGRMTAIERLAWFLLAMARQQRVARAARVHLPMTRLDIADYLGLSVETVSRNLSRLRARCLVEVPGAAEVSILDWPGLEAVADGLPAHSRGGAAASTAGLRDGKHARVALCDPERGKIDRYGRFPPHPAT